MTEKLNLIDIIAVCLITSQVGLTILYFRNTELGHKKITELEGTIQSLKSSAKRLSDRFDETYLLGRLLVEWISVGHEDNETLKSVVDEICLASKSKLVKEVYKDTKEDSERRERFHCAYKKIALYSQNPADVLSALRYLSQAAGAAELLIALRLYARVDEEGDVRFRGRSGWTQDDQDAYLGCMRAWAERLNITGANLRFFFSFGDRQ